MSQKTGTCSLCSKKCSIVLVEVGICFLSKSHLCDKCAASQPCWSTKSPITQDNEDSVNCKNCGTSISDLKASYSLGCSACYMVFSDFLSIELDCIHLKNCCRNAHSCEETDSVMLSKLNHELREAVNREDYENAADIRDKIKQLLGQFDDDKSQ